MATVQIITVTKPGIISYDIFNQGLNTPVPVGTKAIFKSVAPASYPYDLDVIVDNRFNWNRVETWLLPDGNPENYFTIDVLTQNPDGTFAAADKSKLPDWFYTDGVINKAGFGLVKTKHLPWIIAAIIGLVVLSNNKK